MGQLNDPNDVKLMKQNIDFLLSLDALESKEDWDLMSESSGVLQEPSELDGVEGVDSETEGGK